MFLFFYCMYTLSCLCVLINQFYCSDGSWSVWGAWDDCSVTCGGGFMTRHRTCTDPLPSPQGQYCTGEPIEVDSCSANACPGKMLNSHTHGKSDQATILILSLLNFVFTFVISLLQGKPHFDNMFYVSVL